MNDMPEKLWRVGDSERESALSALGEHMSLGRITLDEYADRSAKVAIARTRGDLADLFADLPQPHASTTAPSATSAVTPASTVTPANAVTPAAAPSAAKAHRVWEILGALVTIAAVAVFLLTGLWQVFLLIPLYGMVAKAVPGERHNHCGRGQALERSRRDQPAFDRRQRRQRHEYRRRAKERRW